MEQCKELVKLIFEIYEKYDSEELNKLADLLEQVKKRDWNYCIELINELKKYGEY